MKKNIAIILTLFEIEDYSHYLDYWSQKLNEISKLGYETIIINDNPEVDFSKYFDIQIINNKKNLGKFSSIYNFVSRNDLNSDYIFSCDPDDLISVESLERINSKINKSDDGFGVITMDSFKFDLDDRESVIEIIERDSYNRDIPINEKRVQFTNWTTILNVNSLKKDRIFNKDEMRIKTLCEDIVLGLIAYANNTRTLEIDDNFYFYCASNGVTSSLNSNIVDEFIEGIRTYHSIVKKTNIDYKDNLKVCIPYWIELLDFYYVQKLVDDDQYKRFNSFLIEIEHKLISSKFVGKR